MSALREAPAPRVSPTLPSPAPPPPLPSPASGGGLGRGRGAAGSLPGRRFDAQRPGERSVEFLDRSAARFDADEEKTDNSEQIPGGKVVERGHERIERRLRSDIVGGAGDDRQAG